MTFKLGNIPWNRGIPRREETKKKISENHKGMLGKHCSEEHKKNISLALKGNQNWKLRKNFKHLKKTKLKISEKMKGKKLSEEHKKKLSISNIWMKKLWQNKDFREKRIKAILQGSMKRPTSLEQQMIKIINKYNLPYKYTGDGSFLVGYKNPDFINVNGEKICVEVANTFHHDENYPEKRKEHFKRWGWDCIVFRTNNLNENEVKIRLEEGGKICE